MLMRACWWRCWRQAGQGGGASKNSLTGGDAIPRQIRPSVPPVSRWWPMTAGGICSSRCHVRSICSSSPSSPRAAWFVVQEPPRNGFSAEPGDYGGPAYRWPSYGIWEAGVTRANHGEPMSATPARSAWSSRAALEALDGLDLLWPPRHGRLACTSPSRPVMRLRRRPPGPCCARSRRARRVDSACLTRESLPRLGRWKDPLLVSNAPRDKIRRELGGRLRLQTLSSHGHRQWWKRHIAFH